MARKEQAHQSDDLMEKLVTVNRVAKVVLDVDLRESVGI